MPTLGGLLQKMVQQGASDLHLNAGFPPQIRIEGAIRVLEGDPLTAAEVKELGYSILSQKQIVTIEEEKELDASFGVEDLGRFRMNLYWQRGSLGAAIRYLSFVIPSCEELGIPETVIEMAMQSSGLLILSGAVGSGKSTTLAALIQRIAKTRPMKIVTIEDPVEYLHRHQSATIIQREVGVDTLSPRMAMRSLFRQDPDVIMIGEMRDLETIHTALTLAQTGQLVLGTLHNTDAMQAINRIVDVFPPEQQDQIRLQLSLVLIGVVVQQLVPTVDEKKRVLALEILQNNSAVQNLIRKNEIHQILSVMQTGGEEGMCTLEKSLRRLYEQGIITIGEYEKRSPERKEQARGVSSRQSGMTLLEVIVSSVLLAWLILGMFSVYSVVQKMMQRTNRIQYALFLTQERVEQLTGLGFDGYTGYPNSDGGAAFDPIFFYTPATPFKITEPRSEIAAAIGGDANNFITRYLVRRETMIWNADDWNPDGIVDYRKIEVKVVWSEQPVGP